VVLVCAYLSLVGNLSLGTERFYFFFYIVSLLVAAVLLSRTATKFSYAALAWCTTELLVALISNTLASYGIGWSYLPTNLVPIPLWEKDVYHPLLQDVPKANMHYSVKVDPKVKITIETVGWPMNWAVLEGRTFTYNHNSFGLRGAEPTKADLEKPLIFVYGGSTTYDITVTQGETWIERLQANLNNKYTIFNFGAPGYETTQHLIQTTFYQGMFGKKPTCAVYYIGWNDLLNAHIDRLDEAYADWHVLAMTKRAPDISLSEYSPVLGLVNAVLKLRFDSVPMPKTLGDKPILGGDKRLEQIYVDHVRALKALNAERGVKTVFIGQMMNRAYLKPMPSGNFFSSLIRNEDVWPLQERFNKILKDTAQLDPVAAYIDAGVDHFSVDDFSDMGHFSAAGSKKFAGLISPEIDAHCR